tara:strand:- start:788 stop:1147 length:360 start_codon:yes stop_codon:yes gene_type:complete
MSNRLEKLKSKEEISLLFKDGLNNYHFPFRLTYLYKEQESGVNYFISVPKKQFKKAVDRNKIRRQINEIFINKIDLTFLTNEKLILCISFTGKNKINFNDLEKHLIETFRIFINKQKKK